MPGNDRALPEGHADAAADGARPDIFAAVSDTLGAMIAFLGPDERFLYCNKSFAAWFGRAPSDLVGRSLLEIYGEAGYATLIPHFRGAISGNTIRYERELKHPDGTPRWISVDMRPHVEGGAIAGVITAALEVDELKRTRDALDKAMQVQAFHMDNSPLAVIEWDEGVRVQRWSGQAEAIFGWRADEVMGRASVDIGLVHPDWRPTIRASTLELLEGRVQRNRMISRNLTKSGRYIYCEWFNSAFMDGTGRTRAILSLAQDVTLRVEAEEQLRYTAVHDALTGLMNRQSLIARLEHALARVKRTREMLALLFIDLDRFKAINDTHGHAMGDAFLVEVGKCLKASIRESDTVARIGGDEFVVLLDSEVRPDTPELITRRILDSLARGIVVKEQMLEAGASIGVSFFPADGGDPDALLASADRAMYRQKALGRGAADAPGRGSPEAPGRA